MNIPRMPFEKDRDLSAMRRATDLVIALVNTGVIKKPEKDDEVLRLVRVCTAHFTLYAQDCFEEALHSVNRALEKGSSE